jgi:two-component system NtrC family sensor kinase
MDWPLRTRLLAAFVGVVGVGAVLTVPAGTILINTMVLREAQRRVDLALKTADDMLKRQLAEAEQASMDVAEQVAPSLSAKQRIDAQTLNDARAKRGYDYLHVADRESRIVATARGHAEGIEAADSAVVAEALASRKPAAGIGLMPLEALALEDRALADRARIEVLPTQRAKPGGPEKLDDVMVVEAASPVFGADGRLLGAVHLGTVVNRNFDFVDFVRENVFTVSTYRGRNLGTVTIFQHDVRIATNVKGPDGSRAVGTRVSAEVYDQVLGKGERWTGPAFVVDAWYLSAYEPLRDPESKIIGMLYVGVLKDRYDDMRNQATRLFIGITLLALAVAVALSSWLSTRLTRPLADLTGGAAEVARGNLDYQLSRTTRGGRDEIDRLTAAFNQMVAALRERDEQLRSSNKELQRTASELQHWVQNYLDILEFITHELKNQIAAMKINLLAVRDGYMGEIAQDQKEALSDVAQTIDRSEEMILNYLNLSRIEKGELQVRALPLQLEPDVVRPVLIDFRGRIDEKGMQVEIDLPDDLLVQADPSLLKIVYANLISNAAKYGRQKGTIRLSGERRGGMAELHVWNDGPGVPQEKIEELFRKFSRLAPPLDEQPGTGLGLFIAREIVRQHGGEIHAENAEGEWIDFVFTLPAPNMPREAPSR